MYSKGVRVGVGRNVKALLRFGPSRSTGVESMSGLIYSFITSDVAIQCCHYIRHTSLNASDQYHAICSLIGQYYSRQLVE